MFENNIPDISNEVLDKIRAKVGFLFQSNALYDSMTVRENLEFPLRRHWISVTQQQVNSMVEEALEEVGLAHTIDSMPAELSGGMRKRIALARTLILKPAIILYDEPTTGLDPQARRNLWDLIKEIRDNGTTVIITTHYMDEAEVLCDRVAIIDSGEIIAIDTPNALIDELVATGFEKVKEVKNANLEDVFIHRTGKAWRED